MMKDTLGVRISFGSDNYCPVCNELFKGHNERASLEFAGKHIGWVHHDCRDSFYDLVCRVQAYRENSNA